MVFDGPGKPLRQAEIPVAWPKAGEAIVQVELTTLGSDDFGVIAGKDAAFAPLILGHETVGTILALGDPPPREFNGSPLEEGDRIIWSRYVSCGECFYCRRRLPQECESLREYGRTSLGDPPRLSGGLAELVHLWPKTAIFKAPKSLAANLATAIAHAGAKSLAAIDVLIAPVNTALVLGESVEAKLAAAMLRKRGASVDYLDSTCAIHEADSLSLQSPSERREVDAVLDFYGESFALGFAIREVRIGGAISVLQGSSEMATVDTRELVQKNVRVSGVHRYKPEHLGSALEFAINHANADREILAMLPKTRPLLDVNEAIEEAQKVPSVCIAFEPDQD